ncbi:MAG: hypothetical protein KGY81_08210, partial [Phycisphaerae bacterium]|nr:hypothetical protein [Phycisphaerae bacterium]
RLSQRGDEGDGSSGNDGASDDGRRYATQALRLELNTLYQARPGSRNDTLNRAAFNLGTLVGAGLLDRDEVAAELLAAAEAIGLSRGEAEATIGSGLDSGSKHPRRPPPRPKAVRVTSPATDDWADEAVTLPPGKFKLNLYGNADRFCHLYGRDVLWCEQRGQWFVWDGRCWQPDALRRAAKLAEQTMRALLAEAAALDDKDAVKWAVHCNRSARAMKDLLEVVKHRVAVHSDVFDRDPWVLGIDNGVIDLRTGELHDHDRDRRISRLCPVRYDAEATCPRWQQFMVEIMGGDEAMVDALQRLAGYCLTGDVSVQILSILYGPGGNGKNVWLDTLMGILGPYATEAPEGLLTARQSDEHPTEIADLCGRRLVVASETEAGKKMRIGLVKKLTGNTYLKARFMRQDYFQFTRTHKTLLVTNNRPVVTETSNAVWRRLRLIPFDVTIPAERQDKRLTEKLITEWPGILAWAVRGCLDWQRRRRELDLPRCVAQATEAYRDDSDPVGQFVEEHCLKMAGAKVARSTLYQAYERWARDTGEPILGGKRFAARMRAMGFDECWTTEAGKRARAWGGLGLVAPMKETPGQWD